MGHSAKKGPDALQITGNDNVATALRDLQPGQKVTVATANSFFVLTLIDPISFGHKFALRLILSGSHITKYGEIIGRATVDIAAGAHAHVHNIESLRGRGDLNSDVTPLNESEAR
jgi:altronate dehydratase small subunit